MDRRVGGVGEWRAFGGGGDVSTAQRARGPAARPYSWAVGAVQPHQGKAPQLREEKVEAGLAKGVS
jgi:hypothetical protein